VEVAGNMLLFKGNALNNGLLPIEVSKEELANIFTIIEQDNLTNFTINLETQTLSSDAINQAIQFDINPYKKMCLLKGYDDLDFLLSKRDTINRFQQMDF